MTISLTPDQQARIAARAARGDDVSLEAAALQPIDERIAERGIESDDLSWAKTYVDEALAGVARGDVRSWDDHRARNAVRLAALKG
jgi:antitoxin ParD1/3/4